ncbi:MAG: GAF domain-containing protein [Acidobacteria bacterium]|nr:GAF domain-containing protein [Acidobacteriota bacterium]
MTLVGLSPERPATIEAHERILQRTNRIVERSKQLGALNQIASSVSQSLDFHQTLDSAVEQVSQLMEFEASLIFLINKSSGELTLSAHGGLPPFLVNHIERLKLEKEFIGPALRAGEPLIGPIPRDDGGDLSTHLLSHGFWFFVAIPLRAKGGTLGVMVLASHGPRHVNPDSSQFLISVGDVIGVAIENAALYRNVAELLEETKLQAERLRQSERQFRAIADLGQRALAGTNLSGLINEAVAVVASTLEVEYCKILELLSDSHALLLRAGVGWTEGLVGHLTLPIDSGSQAGYTLRTNEPVIVEDLRTETRFSGPSLLHQHGVISGMSVVIPGKDRPFGILGAHATRRRAFTTDDAHFLQGVANVLAEATERKQAEEALAAETERLAVTLRSIGDGVITTDTDGRVVLINKVAELLTGRTQEEAVDKPLGEVFHIINKKTGERCENAVERVLKAGEVVGLTNHTALLARDGTERIIADSGAPIRDRQGKIFGVVLVFRDITEKQKTEEELLKAQKLESLGLLAGGIAHDFNNILTTILGNITLAEADMRPGDHILGRLVAAETAALRAKDLTYQLLTFSKGGAPIKKTTSIAEIIKESASFALRGSNVRCEFSIPDDLWPVEVDEGQMSQVIQNLIINADQAVPEGGIIHICVKNVTREADADLSLANQQKYVNITITDHGVGIPEEHLPKIFDPYFTTKPGGIGLGLATTYSIIKKHEGHITVASKVGVGTTTTIYLPASEKQLSIKKIESERPCSGQGKILVMDDEQMIRDLTGHILKRFGYQAEFARDGAEAIAIYTKAKESGAPFDAVIMDLTIPGGMGGKEAIKRLAEIDPQVKAIVSSGYCNDPVMSNFREYGFSGCVAKPYRVEDLTQTLHAVLRGDMVKGSAEGKIP